MRVVLRSFACGHKGPVQEGGPWNKTKTNTKYTYKNVKIKTNGRVTLTCGFIDNNENNKNHSYMRPRPIEIVFSDIF